ncbi:hypothetical protein ACOMHN_034604 [Nucella lapillus]
MTKTYKMEDGRGRRLFADINHAFKKDPLIDEYDFLPVMEPQHNASPLVVVEHKLGLELWSVHLLFCYAYNRLLNWRDKSQSSPFLDGQELSQLSRAVLLVNPDCYTAWNIRWLSEASRLLQNLLSPFDNAATVMAGVPESSARLACDFVIAGTSSHSPSDTLDSLVDDDICKHLRRCFFPGRGRPPALPEVQLTNRLLLQLKLLQAEGKKSSKDVSKWFDMLFPDVSYPSTRLSGALDRLEKKVQAVQREDGDIDSFLKTEVDFDFVSSSLSKALSLFLIMPFDTVDKHTPLRSTSSSCCSETVPSTSSVTPQQKEIKQLSKANSVLQVNIKDLSEKVSVLKGALVDVSREKSRVTTDLDRATQQNADLQATIDVLQVKLEESQRKVHQMNPMHLNKLEKRLKTARADLRSVVTRQTVAERKLEKEKNTLQRTRVQTSKLKAAVIKTEWQNEELKQEVQELRQIVSATTVEGLKAELRAGEKNRYSDSVRKTVMALQADANVAASQCGKVISIVGQHLFNVDLKEEDLPKLQTSINIADEGHFLAKFQATETILAADNVTLHTDGTSRGAHKIVGQQITLDSGATLYLGLNTVATEDSETLLEVTIQMLQELSDVYAAEETNDRKEEVFNALLTKLTSCMSDRVAVMKLFSTKLSDFLQSTLGQEVTLHFLKCNAHFLLGLSRSCETSLKTLEEEMTEQLGRKLGRDTHHKFQRFRGNERATARVIRLASSLLGPRGDEKNGCRAEWLAFLKNKSLLTSYRSNRFNCFFLSAAAVVHHQHDMKNFLHGGLLGHSNLKIESLAEDLKDDHLLALVCAVALLYFAITGPFWQLLESNTKYFELHTYIQQLERSVEHWRGDASELLDPGFPGVFGGEFCIVSDMKAAVYKFVSEHTNTVKHALEVLMRDLLVVMRLQLVDFLSGGKYGQAQPPEVMEKLKHCPITNLLDEVRYQKQVLGVGKTLKITKTNGELQQALKAHLGPEQQTDHDSSSEDDLDPPLPKRQRTMEPTPEFTRQGEWVAVFYDQGFFIGQVTLVENPGTAHVSFLENTKSRRDYFRWPRVEDVANVDSQYVFRWDVEVLPVSNDGRIWQVSDLQDIADAYKRLLQ